MSRWRCRTEPLDLPAPDEMGTEEERDAVMTLARHAIQREWTEGVREARHRRRPAPWGVPESVAERRWNGLIMGHVGREG